VAAVPPLANQFIADLQLDYDLRHYPYYGDPFRSTCPPHWSAQLDRLGALAAAEAEQRHPASEAGSDPTSTAGLGPAH